MIGPEAYASWRTRRLRTVTEALEQRLVLSIAGRVAEHCVLDVGCGDGRVDPVAAR